MSLQPNTSDTPFDQKSPRPPEEGVLNCHRQTSGHRDSMTESADSLKNLLCYIGLGHPKSRDILKWHYWFKSMVMQSGRKGLSIRL